jgi:hypothetical protein
MNVVETGSMGYGRPLAGVSGNMGSSVWEFQKDTAQGARRLQDQWSLDRLLLYFYVYERHNSCFATYSILVLCEGGLLTIYKWLARAIDISLVWRALGPRGYVNSKLPINK